MISGGEFQDFSTFAGSVMKRELSSAYRSGSQHPSPQEISQRCLQLQAGWDPRERALRRLRAQMACQFGVCRNV